VSRARWGATLALGASSLGCLDDWTYHPPRATADVVDAADIGGDVAREASVDVPLDAAVDAPMDAALDAPMDAVLDAPEDAAVDAAAELPMDRVEDVASEVSAGAPRLLAPASASRVTSRRPTLRWRAGAGMMRVQVCRDRACAAVAFTTDIFGERAQPAAALDPGVYFWRVSSLSGAATSATWEFVVGRGSAGDTALGCFPDFNGDGFADVAVGAPVGSSTRGHVYVYPGAAGGPASAPTADLAGPSGVQLDGAVDSGSEGQFGAAVACAGDVNGDGFPDLAVGARNFEETHGRAYVFLGSAAGLRDEAVIVLPSRDGFGSEFSATVAGLGDVDGDGYAEVAVGARNAIVGSRVHVYRGAATGTDAAALVTFVGATFGGQVGESIAGDDFDGDGYADLLLGNRNADGTAWAWVFPGGSSGLPARPTVTLSNGLGVRSLHVVAASAGDVDGDRRADVVLGAASPESGGVGRAFVHLGGATGVSVAARVTLISGAAAGFSFGASAAGAGDLNGDGFADVVVGAPESGGLRAGRASVYLGGSVGTSSAAVAVLAGASAVGLFGWSAAGAGDVNRDGFDDLVVGAVGRRIFLRDGVSLFRGESAGVGAAGSSLTNPSPGAEDFGISVAIEWGWWRAPWGQRLTMSGA